VSAIPVIDVGPCFSGVPGALAETAATLRDTLERVGFFVMVNHGVPEPLIDATFAQARRFHDQPMDVKIALKMNEHNNGYMALGRYTVWTSDVNANDKPDLNEAFFCKRELAPEHPCGARAAASSDRTCGRPDCRGSARRCSRMSRPWTP
jgi:isopenicillin N synthase-like dioxygenase